MKLIPRYDKGKKVVYKDQSGNYSTSNNATVGQPVTIRYDVWGQPILHNQVTGEEGQPYNPDEGILEVVGERPKMPWYKKWAYDAGFDPATLKQTVSDLQNLGLASSYETDGNGTTYAVVNPALLNTDLGYASKVPMRFMDKRFHGRTTPFKEATYGEPYTGQSAKYYHIDRNGKIQEGYEDYYDGEVGTISRGRTALKLRDQYANAMHRRRSYTYPGFPYSILRGFKAIKDPQSNSFLLDLPDWSSSIFHVTHFSPETMRGGMRVVGEAATSKTPVLFTVTDDLAPMLEKESFISIGQIPQIFDNKPVMKTIMVNKAMGDKQLLQRELENSGIEGVNIDAIMNKINQAPNPTYKGQSQLKTDPTTHHNFNIMDLLKQK